MKAKELIKFVEQDEEPDKSYLPNDLPGADDLILHIDNTEPIYKMKVEAFKSLTKKKKNGTYDSSLAPKLMMYVVEEGAKSAAKDWNEYNEKNLPWNKVYSMKVRQEAAQELVKDFETAFENKEYNFMD